MHAQIAASTRPDIPLIWSEFNATYMSQPEITDSVYMGPWLAKTISDCDGKVTMMSYWTFSDVFEEQGVIRTPFFGGFGLIAIDHLPKPSFNVFRLLHNLGDQRLPEASKRRAGDEEEGRQLGFGRMEPGGARRDGGCEIHHVDVSGGRSNAT